MFNVQEMEERDYHPETPFNLDIQETRACGDLYPERPWLLSDFDVWVKNPAYRGPPAPHPEYDCGDEDDYIPPDMPDEVFFRVDPLVEALVHNDAKRADRGLPPLNVRYEVDDLPF